jgi:cobalt-zinc-cadmium efflux system outer membrane protein
VHGRLPLALAIALPVAVAACATHAGPDRARVAAGISERSGVDAGGLPAPSRDWSAPPGAGLDDGLTIDEAVSIALWNNARFQTTLASLGLARADLIEAGLLRNPIFSLLFPWGPKQLEFTITWPIDAIWQRPKRIQTARLNADAVAEGLVASGLDVVADVRLAFLEVLAAERRLAFSTEQAESAAQASTLAEGRLRAGDISQFEARLARTDALRLETQRLSRQTARDRAIVQLRSHLGLDPAPASIRLVDPGGLSLDACVVGPDLVRAALAARPDVRAAELQIEASAAQAGLERSRLLAFTASLDANGSGAEGFELGPGAGIELPVLSRNQGGRARAAAELEVASRRYLAVRADVAATVNGAIADLAEAQQAAQLLGDDVAAELATARQQAERLYTAGEISLLSMLEVRRRLIEIDATRVDAQFAVSQATVRLERAVGRTCAAR